MGKVRISLYKTICGKDVLMSVRYFDTIAEAVNCADEWEARALDNYVIYG